jgi:ribosomal-protein-alanine N-acetyltransferase
MRRDIDREAFPTQWPPPDYRRELGNPMARLMVVCDEVQCEANTPAGGVSGLVARVWRRCRFGSRAAASSGESVLGFAGIWLLADEAHITNIAVRRQYQRCGIGALLLIAICDLAVKLNAALITLEVRISNLPAQRLYLKYGFAQTGVRPSYYTDNREDAVLMSTGKITSAPFQTRLRRLKRAHTSRYRITSNLPGKVEAR